MCHFYKLEQTKKQTNKFTVLAKDLATGTNTARTPMMLTLTLTLMLKLCQIQTGDRIQFFCTWPCVLNFIHHWPI